MGDNPSHSKDWHNTQVGVGYQAKGVYRQPAVTTEAVRVLDMSKREKSIEVEKSGKSHKESKEKKRKHSKDSKHKKHKRDKRENEEFPNFNPLLQEFASRLCDNPRDLTFSV